MVTSRMITRFLCMLGMAAALVLLTGCAGGGPGTVVSLNVSASDPKAEVIAIDWFETDKLDEIINPPVRRFQPAYSDAAGVPAAVNTPDWLTSPPLLLEVAQPAPSPATRPDAGSDKGWHQPATPFATTPTLIPAIPRPTTRPAGGAGAVSEKSWQQPLPPPVFGPVPSTEKSRPPYHTQSGVGKLAFQGHLQGGLVIARTGRNVAAASLVTETIFNAVTGYCAVLEKAPADTTDRGRVTEEGVRLALPPASSAPNAVLFARGYGHVVTIDGQKRSDLLNPSIFSLAPGTHSVRINYSRQEVVGNMIHSIWLPRDVEVTFALPPGRVYVLEAFDAMGKVHIELRDATNRGSIIKAQFRSVE